MPTDSNAIKAIFMAALERTTPADRAAYLDEACAGNMALRRRVEALLQAPTTSPTPCSINPPPTTSLRK